MIQGNSNDLALNGIIFHEPIDFPEIRGPISLPKRSLLGAQIGRVRSRANLTRMMKEISWEY